MTISLSPELEGKISKGKKLVPKFSHLLKVSLIQMRYGFSSSKKHGPNSVEVTNTQKWVFAENFSKILMAFQLKSIGLTITTKTKLDKINYSD